VDLGGNGVPGLVVRASAGEGRSRNTAWGRTMNDGSFELTGLAESRYALATQADGGVFAIATGIAAGARQVTLTLRPGGRVRVKVLGADGSPSPRTWLGISRVQGVEVAGGLGSSSTDADGQAEMMVPSGSVELTARSGELEGMATLSVPAGGTGTAELVLRPRTGPSKVVTK
jgi:hypothetical protein